MYKSQGIAKNPKTPCAFNKHEWVATNTEIDGKAIWKCGKCRLSKISMLKPKATAVEAPKECP